MIEVKEKVKYFLFLSGAALAIGWFFHKKAKRKSCDDECKIETDDLMEKSNIEIISDTQLSDLTFKLSDERGKILEHQCHTYEKDFQIEEVQMKYNETSEDVWNSYFEDSWSHLQREDEGTYEDPCQPTWWQLRRVEEWDLDSPTHPFISTYSFQSPSLEQSPPTTPPLPHHSNLLAFSDSSLYSSSTHLLARSSKKPLISHTSNQPFISHTSTQPLISHTSTQPPISHTSTQPPISHISPITHSTPNKQH